MKQQTAVEWLVDKLNSKDWQDLYIWQKEEVYKQAKEMEKNQIVQSHIEGQSFYSCQSEKAEQYYNKTYGGNK